MTLEFEEIQRCFPSRDSVRVIFDGSPSTSIFDMTDLMSVVDQIGKTVTILSHKEEETDEEVSVPRVRMSIHIANEELT